MLVSSSQGVVKRQGPVRTSVSLKRSHEGKIRITALHGLATVTDAIHEEEHVDNHIGLAYSKPTESMHHLIMTH